MATVLEYLVDIGDDNTVTPVTGESYISGLVLDQLTGLAVYLPGVSQARTVQELRSPQ